MENRRAEAHERLQAAVALDPRNAAAHFSLANLHAKQENWDEAIRQYRLTLDLQPSYPDAERRLQLATQRKGEG